MDLSESESDSSDISLTYSDGEVVCCLGHSSESDDTEKSFHLKVTRRLSLKSRHLEKREREDITRILLRRSPCSFLIYPQDASLIVKEVDIAQHISKITDGQYSVAYVTQSLFGNIDKQQVQSVGKICDICIFTTESPTLVLTLVGDGKEHKDDNIFYNTHLARKITGLVRKETLNNFSVISGVVSKTKFTSQKDFEDFIKKRTNEAFKLAMPYSLDVDGDRWSAILTCFMNRISSCIAHTTLFAVPLVQGCKLFPDMDSEFTAEEILEEASDSSDQSDQESQFLWDLKKYRPTSQLPVGPAINIVLIGRLGNGKSATANTIFGQQLCDDSSIQDADKQRCLLHHGVVGGREIKLVDTVGRMDPENSRKILEEVGSAIYLCPDGFDAIVFVLRLTQIHDDEKKAIENMKRLFNDQGLIRKYGIIVFTGGDKYEKTSRIQDYILQAGDAFVKKLMIECKERILVFNNKLSPDDYESEKQVIRLVKEIDWLMQKNSFAKYKTLSFKEAYYFHQNIEESSQKQRLMIDREKTVFEEKIRHKEKDEKEQKMTARDREIMIIIGIEKDHIKTEMQAFIQEKRSIVKKQLFLILRQENVKKQKDWLSQLDMTNDTHTAELNRLIDEEYEVQSANWDRVIQEKTQAMKVAVDQIVQKGKRQVDDHRKVSLQSMFEAGLQENKKHMDIQWRKICKETLNEKIGILRKQILCATMEREEYWKKAFTDFCDVYTESFDCESTSVIQKALSEVDLQVKHLKLDTNWRKELELLKKRLILKWSTFPPENWLQQYTWIYMDMSRNWEKSCHEMLKSKLELKMADTRVYLGDEKQRLEKIFFFQILQKGKEHLEIIREEFSDSDKWSRIKQVEKMLWPQTTEEIMWKKRFQTMVGELCSSLEMKWNSKDTDLTPQLNEAELRTDVYNVLMSDTLQADILEESWRRMVNYILDENCLRYMEKISKLESASKRKWIKEVRVTYTGKEVQLAEKETKLERGWKLDDKEATLKKLIKDDDKLAKALAHWKSFERDWYNIASREKGKFESKWNAILKELVSEDVVSAEAETSYFREMLEKKMEHQRISDEQQWRSERNSLCQFHLEHFWQENINLIISRETKQHQDNLRHVMKRQNREWLEEASVFLALKEMYWNACVETDHVVLRDTFINIIERNMDTQEENWRETALGECNILTEDWKQELSSKRESQERAWVEKLRQLRRKRELEWNMELQIMTRQWNKIVLECIEDELKVSKVTLNKKILENRKLAETDWEKRDSKLTEQFMSSALKGAAKKGEDCRKEKLKTIHDRRQMEEEKWSIDLNMLRLQMEEQTLNEILTEVFEKNFADSNTCFPSTAKVLTQAGKEIEMRQLKMGEFILCSSMNGDLIYSDVFRFGHNTEEGHNIFVSISTKTKTLRLSPNHHVVLGGHSSPRRALPHPIGTKAAADVQIGDILLVYEKEGRHLITEAVVDVIPVIESGLYAPYTQSGNVIVDHVLASCYVNRVKPCVAHGLLAPARLFHRLTCNVTNFFKQGK